MLNPIGGEIFCVDKPLKWTSFDAVKRIRGVLARRSHKKRLKVGHAGTLDPLATGVLIVCTGKATKRIEDLQLGEKEYVATLRFGATTPSFDLETEINAEYPTDGLTIEKVIAALDSFRGDIMQVPPAFSACKVDGRRAYKSARKGREVVIDAKPIRISEIEVVSANLPDVTLRIVCGKGTYIRALARDLGETLGCGAHLIALRRTRVGDVSIDKCMTVDELVKMLDEAPVMTLEEYEKLNKTPNIED